MTPNAAVARIARIISRELEADATPSDSAREAGPMLAEAGATAGIADALLAEARRKRPSDRMINAYAFLLETALTALRLRANGGHTQSTRDIEAVRTRIGQALDDGLAPELLMLLARAFTQAELDPGAALQDAMAAALEAHAARGPTQVSLEDIARHFDDMAAALGGDPFAIHAELAATGAAFPPEHRAAMVAGLARSGSPALREAALGFVLADRATSAAVLTALAQPRRGLPAANPPVSSRMVERLVRLRPWVDAARRDGVDAAIRALRPQAAAPTPAPAAEVRVVLASLCDGAGAQSLFVLVKRGRQFALASVLIKAGIGVADAWVRDGLSKRDADTITRQIVAEAEAVPVTLVFAEQRLADALATNAETGQPPPFGLLQVAEALGFGPLHPLAVAPAALADALLAGLPADRTGPAAVRAAQQATAAWDGRYRTLGSWFEAGEAVDALLQPLRGRKQREAAVMTQLLPARRGFWAERCAWMAATLRASDPQQDADWIDFALLARDLAGAAPLQDMRLAKAIAATTAEAFGRR